MYQTLCWTLGTQSWPNASPSSQNVKLERRVVRLMIKSSGHTERRAGVVQGAWGACGRGLFLGQSGQGVSYSVMAGRGVLAVKPVPGRVELGCRFCRVPGEGFMVTPSE